MEKAYQLAAWLRRLEILPIQAPARWDVELGIVDDLLVVGGPCSLGAFWVWGGARV
ncbi:hypothetical protein SK1NUM_15780 [Arachnia rubra]|nr:hypothetical protein SK1NUM_15780 [Arachnia rubra]